jgi:adenylate cyclase
VPPPKEKGAQVAERIAAAQVHVAEALSYRRVMVGGKAAPRRAITPIAIVAFCGHYFNPWSAKSIKPRIRAQARPVPGTWMWPEGNLETRPSAEIEAVVIRWLDAHSKKSGRALTNMLSKSEHLRYLGSAPDEYWSGSLLRRGLAQHLAEVPDWTANGIVIEGFERGEVGWAIWRGQLGFAGRDAILDVRFSFVLTLEDGVWRIVQVHCSMGQPNLAFSGIEHNAFSELIEAAKTGNERIGGEGAGVIMFTDIANSTEIANAVGDREWAMAIGKHFDLQASAISKHDGVLVKTLGDGSMSSFGAAGGALRAAMAIQAAASAISDDLQLKLRIGIHAGDLIRTDDDFYGTVVNKASRITGLAQPNEILVSDVARAMAGESSEFKFGDPIRVALRGIEGQHTVSDLRWIR